VDVDDEDSLSARLGRGSTVGLVDIAVVRLPRLSNFTDFNPLERMEEVSLRYVQSPRELGAPDLVILPGTKNTMDDLRWLRESGMEAQILKHAHQGGAVVGICGGYQMLGSQVSDPDHVEGGGTLRGLGLLPGSTVFQGEKTRTLVEGRFCGGTGIFAPMSGTAFRGYEIHMGETTPEDGAQPVLSFQDQSGKVRRDGLARGNVWGSYVHGIFDQGECAGALVNCLLKAKGLTRQAAVMDWAAYAQLQYDKLADGLRAALDMDLVYRILNREA
jgi:adenosylcobyric acid synthase